METVFVGIIHDAESADVARVTRAKPLVTNCRERLIAHVEYLPLAASYRPNVKSLHKVGVYVFATSFVFVDFLISPY